MNYPDDSKTIYTDDGDSIPWLHKTYENYLDKTTLVFGGTGSGKTTIIEEILYYCRPFIPNYMVVAPRTSDKAYRKKLPAKCIKEDLTKARLQKIWSRQVNLTKVFNIANEITNLESLFLRAPDRQSAIMVRAMIEAAKNKIDMINRNTTLDFAQQKAQITTVEESRNKKIKMQYKQTIRQYKSMLEKQELTDVERITLVNLDLNPRLMLIIDDCSEKFKGWMKMFKSNETNPFECFFYKGRHNFITLVLALHDDKLLDTELRKNARVAIFTNSQSLVASINKQQSGYTNKEKKDAMKMAGRIFGNEESGIKTHQKFCYVREDVHPFKYTIANLYPEFELGGDPLRELISKMPKKDDDLESNPFLKDIVAQTENKPKKSSGLQKRKPRLKYD